MQEPLASKDKNQPFNNIRLVTESATKKVRLTATVPVGRSRQNEKECEHETAFTEENTEAGLYEIYE